MAKTSFQLIPPEFDLSYSKTLKSGDRFVYSSVRLSPQFISRKRVEGLTQASLIPVLAPVWAAFSSADQLAWNNAGAVCGYTGFRLFVQDTSYRIKNSLSGYSTPLLEHQSLVGRINIISPATEIKISQEHPLDYWVLRKVHGTRNQYEPVHIREDFDLPVEIQISYKTDLVSAGLSPRARYYLVVQSHYQGSIIETDLSLEFGLTDAWQTVSASLSSVKGVVRGYTAFIELVDVQGDFFFDNVKINHSGFNWARDPRCNDINQEFTHAFYQIPKHWGVVTLPSGAFYDSFFADPI